MLEFERDELSAQACLRETPYSEQDQENLLWYLDILARSCRHAMDSGYFEQYHLLKRNQAGLTEYGAEILKKISMIYTEVIHLKKAAHWMMNLTGRQMVESGRFKVFAYALVPGRPDLVQARIGNASSTYVIYVSPEFQQLNPVNAVSKIPESREIINFIARGMDENFSTVRDLAIQHYSEYLNNTNLDA